VRTRSNVFPDALRVFFPTAITLLFLYFSFSDFQSISAKTKGKTKTGHRDRNMLRSLAKRAVQSRASLSQRAAAARAPSSLSPGIFVEKVRSVSILFYSFMFSIFLMLRVCVWGGDRIDF